MTPLSDYLNRRSAEQRALFYAISSIIVSLCCRLMNVTVEYWACDSHEKSIVESVILRENEFKSRALCRRPGYSASQHPAILHVGS